MTDKQKTYSLSEIQQKFFPRTTLDELNQQCVNNSLFQFLEVDRKNKVEDKQSSPNKRK